jgi:hypothetical protein
LVGCIIQGKINTSLFMIYSRATDLEYIGWVTTQLKLASLVPGDGFHDINGPSTARKGQDRDSLRPITWLKCLIWHSSRSWVSSHTNIFTIENYRPPARFRDPLARADVLMGEGYYVY